MPLARRTLLPVTSRYVIRELIAILVPTVLTFVLLYLVVDFFDRLDILLRNHATPLAAFRYFVLKIPLILTQIMPAAVLTAMLLSLGMLSRRNEIIALRAAGISLAQTALPLLGVAALISLAILAWNESIVPYCTREYQYVNNVEIRKRPQRGILSEREIWYHGADGFYNIEHIDPHNQTLFGLTIYRTDSTFNLQSIIQVASARWTREGWVSTGALERTTDPAGDVVTRRLGPHQLVLHETPNDFLEVRREPDELSYLALRRRIRELASKGIDASSYLVDLHLKLAVPFATLVLAWMAVPLAGRVQRHPSVAAIVGTGMVVGFAFWVVLALANSLGLSSVLPAAVSAWASNVIFALLGTALFAGSE
ncbi:MAG: LPS export ABC transporter permease LptG [Candidatus Binatia bacterium]